MDEPEPTSKQRGRPPTSRGDAMRHDFADGMTVQECAVKYGVTYQVAHRITIGFLRRHPGHPSLDSVDSTEDGDPF